MPTILPERPVNTSPLVAGNRPPVFRYTPKKPFHMLNFRFATIVRDRS